MNVTYQDFISLHNKQNCGKVLSKPSQYERTKLKQRSPNSLTSFKLL